MRRALLFLLLVCLPALAAFDLVTPAGKLSLTADGVYAGGRLLAPGPHGLVGLYGLTGGQAALVRAEGPGGRHRFVHLPPGGPVTVTKVFGPARSPSEITQMAAKVVVIFRPEGEGAAVFVFQDGELVDFDA